MIAQDYATDDTHRLLRITLTDADLDKLVVSAANRTPFDSMQDAVDAAECTALVTIAPNCIEYLTQANAWQAIGTFPNPTPWKGGAG